MEELKINLSLKSHNITNKIENILNQPSIYKPIEQRLKEDFLENKGNHKNKVCYVEVRDMSPNPFSSPSVTSPRTPLVLPFPKVASKGSKVNRDALKTHETIDLNKIELGKKIKMQAKFPIYNNSPPYVQNELQNDFFAGVLNLNKKIKENNPKKTKTPAKKTKTPTKKMNGGSRTRCKRGPRRQENRTKKKSQVTKRKYLKLLYK